MRQFLLISSLSVFALGGCVTAESVPVPEVHCLPLVEYTAADQKKAASELSELPSKSILRRMMTDYGRMRAGDRACLEHGGDGAQ